MLNHGIKDRQSNWLFMLFLVVHMVMWTLLPGLTRHELDSDSMMHFAWGQEWMLSYNLHPPFLPWVVAGFLKLVGISNWSYLFLSQINIAIAFIAIYLLAKQFLRPAQALAAVCLLEFIPYYSFLSIRLNHSSMLISIWALTALFAYYAISRRRLMYWIVLGFCLAIGMLTKYYAITLVGAIGLYIVSTHQGRAQLRTLGPYASALVFGLLLYVHVDYVSEHRIGTVQHINDYFFLDSLSIRWKAVSFFLAQLVYLLPSVIAFMLATYSSSLSRRLPILLRLPNLPENAGLTYTVLLFPLLITAIPGLILGVDISSRWGGPILITAGIMLILQFPLNLTGIQCRRIVIGSIVYAFVVPLIMLGVISQGGVESRYSFPGKELATTVTDLWHDSFGSKLRLVGGGWMAPDSIAFHSIDHPSVLQHLSHQWSPWVRKSDIQKHGIAIVCLSDDELCLTNANRMFPSFKFRTLTIKGNDFGLSHSRTERFRYFLVPPKSTNIQLDNVLHNPRR